MAFPETLKRLARRYTSVFEEYFGTSFSIVFTLPLQLGTLRMRLPPPDGRRAEIARCAIAAASLLLLLILAALAASYLVPLSFASFPAWASAIALYAAYLHVLRRRQIRQLDLPQTLARMTTAALDQRRARWKSVPEEVAAFKDLRPASIRGLMLSLLLVGAILAILASQRAFAPQSLDSRSTWPPVPEAIHAALAALVSAAWIVAAARIVESQGLLQPAIEPALQSAVDGLNARVDESAAALDAETERIEELAARLQISFSLNSHQALQRLLDENKDAILIDPQCLPALIQPLLDRAREARTELQKAEEVQSAAAHVFHDMSREVQKTGLRPLIQELERNFKRLQSPEVRSFLERGDWAGYDHAFSQIVDYIERIWRMSQHSGAREAPKLTAGSDHDKALSILRLPPSADSEDLRKAYRWLSTVWHPDRGLVNSDEEFKRINWAYQYLRRNHLRD